MKSNSQRLPKVRPQVHLHLPPETAAAVTPDLIKAVEALIQAAGPSLRGRAKAAGEGLIQAVAEAKAPAEVAEKVVAEIKGATVAAEIKEATVAAKVAAVLMEARADVGNPTVQENPVEEKDTTLTKEGEDDRRSH
jgi:hypothetical protein